MRDDPWANWNPVAIKPSKAKPGEYEVEGFDERTNARYSRAVTRAAQRYLGLKGALAQREVPAGRRGERRRLRLAYRELVVRFERRVKETEAFRLLAAFGFRVVDRSPFTENQWIAAAPEGSPLVGQGLYDAADQIGRRRDAGVVFAWPNLITEFRRAGTPGVARRWPFDAIHVNYATGRRRLPKGKKDIVIAVLDDGVDLAHPNLAHRLCTDPDPADPQDKGGRDFTVMENDPEYFHPTPHVGDYHGTACAGVAVADGKKGNLYGAAPGCRFISVRMLDNGSLIPDTRVAAAIRYATRVADVMICSWTGAEHADVTAALAEAAAGRGGKGVPVFCASGNDGDDYVGYPASLDTTIAVGGCTHAGAPILMNTGPELDIVAPSRGDGQSIFTTDVAGSGGRNPGDPTRGDSAGMFWNNFGGTSAANAIAAGVGALCLSVNPDLTRDELLSLLRNTADKIGTDHDANGFSPTFGYGCVNAAEAVAEARSWS
jgi:hypothetical protein